tara:strand:+ start:3770 stop:4534 length:765 start_codon:yes stop_codon:yes gene_type:complete
MDANAMANELDQQVDRATSFGSPGYEDVDYSSVLTDAMHVYIKQFIDRKNNRKGESLEETEVRSQGLSALIARAVLTASTDQTGVFANGTFYDLPNGTNDSFMYTIHEEGTIDKKICTDGVTPISTIFNVVSHDEVSRLSKNKYKKPYFTTYGDSMTWRLVFSRETSGELPSAVATAKRHQLVTDGTYNIESYAINYLINPPNIVVDRDTVADQRNCILDESTHLPIIDIAKSLLLERVREQDLVNTMSSKDLE